jgi:hypothetical protein
MGLARFSAGLTEYLRCISKHPLRAASSPSGSLLGHLPTKAISLACPLRKAVDILQLLSLHYCVSLKLNGAPKVS